MWEVEPIPHYREARISGIRSGSLSFLDLPGRAVSLRAGDDFDVALREGFLHSLTLSPEGSTFYLSGVAEEVQRRIGFSSESQLPTWYDKLAHVPAVRAAFGMLTLLAGLGLHQLILRQR